MNAERAALEESPGLRPGSSFSEIEDPEAYLESFRIERSIADADAAARVRAAQRGNGKKVKSS